MIALSFGAKQNALRQYFKSYEFLKIFDVVYVCLGNGHANTRKHVYEHGCSYVRWCFDILAHLAQFFFLILNGIRQAWGDRGIFWPVIF